MASRPWLQLTHGVLLLLISFIQTAESSDYGMPLYFGYSPGPVQTPSSAPREGVVNTMYPRCTASATSACPPYILANRTDEMLLKELNAEACLWKGQCKGNDTAVPDKFFGQAGTRDYLLGYDGPCLTGEGNRTCTPELAKAIEPIKEWMRGAACKSTLRTYRFLQNTRETASGCCDVCLAEAGRVELFYWPDPDADTSCLSIIGDNVPINYGATTDRSGTVGWGCTGTDIMGKSTFAMTARLDSTNTLLPNITTKRYDLSPWDTSLRSIWCGNNSVPTTLMPPQQLAHMSSGRVSFGVTAKMIDVPASARWNNQSRPTTVVSNGFTFTSPTVYASFTGIRARDECGATTLAPTMYAFAPGELSSIESAHEDDVTRAFNTKDLPCPPQDVQSRQRWIPSPGDPYNPLIAFPSQLRSVNEWFSLCGIGLFRAFDPPRILDAVPTMAADPSEADPNEKGPVPANVVQPELPKKTEAKQMVNEMVSPTNDPAMPTTPPTALPDKVQPDVKNEPGPAPISKVQPDRAIPAGTDSDSKPDPADGKKKQLSDPGSSAVPGDPVPSSVPKAQAAGSEPVGDPRALAVTADKSSQDPSSGPPQSKPATAAPPNTPDGQGTNDGQPGNAAIAGSSDMTEGQASPPDTENPGSGRNTAVNGPVAPQTGSKSPQGVPTGDDSQAPPTQSKDDSDSKGIVDSILHGTALQPSKQQSPSAQGPPTSPQQQAGPNSGASSQSQVKGSDSQVSAPDTQNAGAGSGDPIASAKAIINSNRRPDPEQSPDASNGRPDTLGASSQSQQGAGSAPFVDPVDSKSKSVDTAGAGLQASNHQQKAEQQQQQQQQPAQVAPASQGGGSKVQSAAVNPNILNSGNNGGFQPAVAKASMTVNGRPVAIEQPSQSAALQPKGSETGLGTGSFSATSNKQASGLVPGGLLVASIRPVLSNNGTSGVSTRTTINRSVILQQSASPPNSVANSTSTTRSVETFQSAGSRIGFAGRWRTCWLGGVVVFILSVELIA